jgi:tetratricopeptide (TPR) repeat protein
VGAVGAVADAGDDLPAVIARLCDGGLLAEVPGAAEPTYRFRHALIQDATYRSLMKGERRRLHAKAASALEDAPPDRVEDTAALLGHHYALAGDTERAAHFLALAADHASNAFANEQAINSTRRALELLEPSYGKRSARAAAIWEKLGRVLWRVGRYEEACAAYQQGALAAIADDQLLAGRCFSAIGYLVSQGLQRNDDAISAFDAAEEILDQVSEKDSDEWVAAWLSVQLGRIHHFYWLDTKQVEAVLARARPVVDSRGAPPERAGFYALLGHVRARARRYQVDESIVADFRTGKAATEEIGECSRTAGADLALARYWAYFQVGFALWWYGDIEAALEELDQALRAAVRTGQKLLEVLTRTFVTLAYFRQGNVSAVREMAASLDELASAMALPENVGVARAAMSWVAWKEGRVNEVEALGQEALENWEGSVRRYPLDWLCLFPLISVQLHAGHYEEAKVATHKLLGPHQMRLPDELEAAVKAAITSWDAGQTEVAVHRLEKVVKVAEQLSFA